MKGQVSLEFIIVVAIFLGALSIWLGGVVDVQGAISIAMGSQQVGIAADKLSTAINSVCVMGAGNEIEIRSTISGNATIIYKDNFLMTWSNRTFERKAYC